MYYLEKQKQNQTTTVCNEMILLDCQNLEYSGKVHLVLRCTILETYSGPYNELHHIVGNFYHLTFIVDPPPPPGNILAETQSAVGFF